LAAEGKNDVSMGISHNAAFLHLTSLSTMPWEAGTAERVLLLVDSLYEGPWLYHWKKHNG